MRRLCVLLIAALLVGSPARAAFINYSSREINVKVVYYGSETSGLAENLEYVYSKTNPESKGKLITLSTETDRTLFFDFLPLSLGEIRGFKTRFHLYTVPGKVSYDASRKLILKGVDGIVFVYDADPKQLVANLQSWRGMQANLKDQGYDWKTMPIVVQVDTHRFKGAVSTPTIARDLGVGDRPLFVADPSTGQGVFDTLKAVAKGVLLELKKGATDSAAAPAPAPAPAKKKEGCGIYAMVPGSGCRADRAKAVAAIRASTLSKHAADLERGLSPTVWLEPQPPLATGVPVGDSHFRGLPDLPDGAAWPRHKDRSLELVAQVRLADTPHDLGLPKTGWLAAFCPFSDPEWFAEANDGSCRVMYFDGAAERLHRRKPEGRAATAHESAQVPIRFVAGFTLQTSGEAAADDYAAFDALEASLSNRGAETGHRLRGASTPVQDDPRYECVIAADGVSPLDAPASAAAAEKWVLLLQVDSDDAQGLGFGDVGSLYFLIKKADLAARKFDQVCVVAQDD